VGRRLKTFVVLLMLVLMPVRAFASVTDDACAMAHQAPPAGESIDHDGALHEHGGAQHSHDDAKHDHGEHCASASFAAPAETLLLPPPVSAGGVVHEQYSAASFIPEQPDPPPLAL
jgi:hypothetical protein